MKIDCRLKTNFEHEFNRLCSNQLHNSFNTLNDDLSGDYESKCKNCPMCNSSICNNDELNIEDVEILQKWSDENNFNNIIKKDTDIYKFEDEQESD